MKKSFLIVFCLVLSGTFLFSLGKDLRKIDVSVRPLRPGDHRAAITEATTTIEASPEVVTRALVDDLDAWSRFIPRLLSGRVISEAKVKEILKAGNLDYSGVLKIIGDEKVPHQATYYYLYYLNYPWPLGNKWIICREVDEINSARHTFHRNYRLVVGQLVKADGEWLVKPHPENPNWSIITYINIGDAGFQVPHFIGKLICLGQARNVLESVRKRAEAYAGVK